MTKTELKFLFVLSLIFLLFSCGNRAENQTAERTESDIDYYVKVVNVADGDTFTGITDDNESIRFRLQGVDAPERTQAFSRKSTDKLIELIHKKEVGIITHTPSDRYGRPVVYVITPEGKDVGAELLKAGLAWHYKYYDDSELYETLENKARFDKIGLWRDNNPIPPWEFRRNQRSGNQRN